MEIPDAPLDRSNEAELTRQWWTAKAECLTDNGFTAYYDGEGLTIGGGGEGQREARRTQSNLCHEETTARLGPLPVEIPYSTGELRAKHALLLETVACLEQNGYPQTSGPPSEESFVANEHLIYAGNEQATGEPVEPVSGGSERLSRCGGGLPVPHGPRDHRLARGEFPVVDVWG